MREAVGKKQKSIIQMVIKKLTKVLRKTLLNIYIKSHQVQLNQINEQELRYSKHAGKQNLHKKYHHTSIFMHFISSVNPLALYITFEINNEEYWAENGSN